MKLFKAIALAAISILLLSACEKEPSMQTVLITVFPESWQYSEDSDNNFFFATVKMPEINESVFKNGLVKMYRVYHWKEKDAAQTELPFVRHNEYEAEDGNWYFYTETIDYQFSVRELTLFYTMSDFNYELVDYFNPGQMDFRCVIIY